MTGRALGRAWIAVLVIAGAGTVPTRSLAQAQDPPDIVVIVSDDQRAGTTASMPNLRDRVAANGTTFTRAFVPNALCCPARVSILTGDHSHTNGVWRNGGRYGFPAFDDSATLATWLDDAGYRTGLFGKYLNGWWLDDPTYVPPGWDEWFSFLASCCAYDGFSASVNGAQQDFGSDVYGTTESARRAAEFITSTTGPLFVYWAPSAPHWPATPEPRYEGAFADLEPWRPPSYNEADVSDKPAWVQRQPRWTSDEIQRVDALRRREFESLLSVDDGLGMLLDALEASGRLDNTLLVYTSDNGMMWGEHRLASKPYPWKADHHVPLIVRDDAIGADGVRSTSLVSTIDIAATVSERLGLDRVTDGRSLIPLLTGSDQRIRRRLLLEHASGGAAPAYCGARSTHHLFVRYTTGEEEFYDYRTDRWELRNAVARPSVRRVVRSMRRFTQRSCVPRPPGFWW